MAESIDARDAESRKLTLNRRLVAPFGVLLGGLAVSALILASGGESKRARVDHGDDHVRGGRVAVLIGDGEDDAVVAGRGVGPGRDRDPGLGGLAAGNLHGGAAGAGLPGPEHQERVGALLAVRDATDQADGIPEVVLGEAQGAVDLGGGELVISLDDHRDGVLGGLALRVGGRQGDGVHAAGQGGGEAHLPLRVGLDGAELHVDIRHPHDGGEVTQSICIRHGSQELDGVEIEVDRPILGRGDGDRGRHIGLVAYRDIGAATRSVAEQSQAQAQARRRHAHINSRTEIGAFSHRTTRVATLLCRTK